jgi:hypothetical protein
MKKLIMLLSFAFCTVTSPLLTCWADVVLGQGTTAVTPQALQWNIPGGIGTVQIPSTASDILPLVGYDFLKKQMIAGASSSLITLFKDLNGYVGAVGEWQAQTPNVQPYVGAGADFAKYIPGLSQIANLQVQGFVRYVASTGNHLGAGGALSYKFSGFPTATP